MRNNLLIIVAVFCFFSCNPCVIHAQTPQQTPYRDKNGKWGVADGSGRVIIKPEYAVVAEFNGNAYIVGVQYGGDNARNMKFGVFSTEGRVLLPVDYNEIGDFSLTGFAVVRKGNKYGIINDKYQFVVPCKYAAVGKFNEQGFVWVNSGGSCDMESDGKVVGGNFGVYNEKGIMVVPAKYKAIGTFVREKSKYAHPFASFSNIPSEFKDIEQESESYNAYNYSYVEERLMSELDMSLDSLIVVSESRNYTGDGIVGADGEMLMPMNLTTMLFYPNEGIVPLCRFEEGLLHANYFVIQRQSLMFNNWPQVDCITSFNLGRAIVAVRDANRFIDGNGAKLGKPYKIILPSETGSFIVVAGGKYGLIDNEGNEITNTEYSVIHPMQESMMLARHDKGGPICYLNPDGTVAISTRYKNGTSFKNGAAMVQSDQGWGMIDVSGHQLLSCKWYMIKNPTDTACPLFWVRTERGGRFYCVDSRSGVKAFYSSFVDVENFSEYYENIAFVYDNDRKVGCIDAKGNTIIPCVLDDLRSALDAYLSMLKDGKEKWSDFDLQLWSKRKSTSSKSYSIDATISNNLWDY